MKVSSFGWEFNRLHAMSLPEILWRLKQLFKTKIERRAGIGLALHPPEPYGKAGRAWLTVLPTDFGSEPYRAAAERILSGQFDIFAMHNTHLGFSPHWNRDPGTAIEAPLLFGKILDYRNEKLIGSIKYLWELNRHLELTILAQAFHLTGEKRYAEGAQRLLESWFEQCQYPLGPNWISALEQAVRLVNWSFTWHLLGGDNSALFNSAAGQTFRRHWLDSIYQHLHFIRNNFSRYSSANNHLLGEYMGLFIGTTTWPLWKDCSAWSSIARNGLEMEALKQNTKDGVNREQATWYHHEVADMMLLCGLVGKANSIAFSASYWDRLETMFEYIASIMDVAGRVPAIGDADDAVMVRFSSEAGFNVYRSLLATGSVLFNRSEFKIKAGQFDDKSRWLLGDDKARQFEELAVNNGNLPVRRAFQEGGYYVLGDKFETKNEVRIVADAGDLGYLSIAAHGHADALSFTLSVNGIEMLIDSGTYTYHSNKKWRNYFRGTSAHNTMRVDGEDQSVAGGNFLWTRHAHARCDAFVTRPNQDEWGGSHDGYLRLPKGVRHLRKIVFDKQHGLIEVKDSLEGQGQHKVELFWHFSEECVVTVDGGKVTVRNGSAKLSISMPERLFVRAGKGREDPPLGWISRRFDEKVPITTVVCEGTTLAGGDSMRTLIKVEQD